LNKIDEYLGVESWLTDNRRNPPVQLSSRAWGEFRDGIPKLLQRLNKKIKRIVRLFLHCLERTIAKLGKLKINCGLQGLQDRPISYPDRDALLREDTPHLPNAFREGRRSFWVRPKVEVRSAQSDSQHVGPHCG
jgi:hypothetical protein